MPEAIREPVSELMRLKYILGMGKARFVDLDVDGHVGCIGPVVNPSYFVYAAKGANCGGEERGEDAPPLKPLEGKIRRDASEAMLLEQHVLELFRTHGIDRMN